MCDPGLLGLLICCFAIFFTVSVSAQDRAGTFTEDPDNDAPAPFVQGLTTGVLPSNLEVLEGQHYLDGQPAAWDVDSYALANSDTTGILRMIYDFPESYWPALGYYFLCAWDIDWSDLECSYKSAGDGRPSLMIPVFPESELFVSTAVGYYNNPDNTVLIMEDPLRLVSQSETFGIDAGRTGDYVIQRTGDFVGFPVLEEVPAYLQEFVFGDGDRYCVSDAVDALGKVDQVDAYTSYLNGAEFEDENRQVLLKIPLTDRTGNTLDLETLGFQLRGNNDSDVYVFSGSGELLYFDGADENDPSFDEFYEEGEFSLYQGDITPIIPVGSLAEHDLSDEEYLVIMFGLVARDSNTLEGCAHAARSGWPIKQGQVYLMPIYPQPPTIELDPTRVRSTNSGLEIELDVGERNQISYVEITATNGDDYTSTDSVRVAWRSDSTESYTALLDSAPVGDQLTVTVQPLGRSMYFEHQPVGEPTNFTINVPVDDEEGATEPRDFTVSHVWPNPVRKSATVSITTPVPTTVTYQVFDVLGRSVIQDETRVTTTHELVLDVSGLTSGFYFCQVRSEVDNTVKAVRMTVVN